MAVERNLCFPVDKALSSTIPRRVIGSSIHRRPRTTEIRSFRHSSKLWTKLGYIWIYSAYFTTLTECSCHTTMSLWFGHCILLHNNKYCYVDVLSEWSGIIRIIRTYMYILVYINIHLCTCRDTFNMYFAADVVLETNLL